MSAGDDSSRPIIIVKRPKRAAAGHHGGAWKVAYADFVTAMMAFFMVMWLVASVSKEQRAAIFDYFKNPSMEPGKSPTPAPGLNGPGGASTSPIDLGGGLDAPKFTAAASTTPGLGEPVNPNLLTAPVDPEEAAQRQAEADLEKKNLESLMDDLKEAIANSQALAPFKDQLKIDLSPEGLRIQIVDAQNRAMFDTGSTELKDYTREILTELAKYLNSVPNHLSLSGHTDDHPFVGRRGYSNWELSTERANAARRALENGGLGPEKTMRVVGLASLVPFDKGNPDSPINRRISIIVMTRDAEEQALRKLNAPIAPEAISVPYDALPAGAPAAAVPAEAAVTAGSTG
jgi:chemotaxis protein MotB